jgi:hypothetical protein
VFNKKTVLSTNTALSKRAESALARLLLLRACRLAEKGLGDYARPFKLTTLMIA